MGCSRLSEQLPLELGLKLDIDVKIQKQLFKAFRATSIRIRIETNFHNGQAIVTARLSEQLPLELGLKPNVQKIYSRDGIDFQSNFH